jgi:hypothetical protein
MDREGMDTLEFSNLEGISAELKHKFATDFVSVISKVERTFYQRLWIMCVLIFV